MDTQKLVKECIREIPAAQRQLYDHFAETMLGICYRYTKSMDDAEDVLQDGFVKVFRNLGQYKYEGELGAWVRRIMVTTALNFLKKNSRYNHEFSFDNENLHPVADDNPEIKMTGKELADLISALASLAWSLVPFAIMIWFGRDSRCSAGRRSQYFT